MKGKTRTQKGITLVALIITIVLLLILAAVTVNSIQDTKLIQHANEVAIKYNQAHANEQTIIDGYLEYISGSTTVTPGEPIEPDEPFEPVEPIIGQYVEYNVSYTDICLTTSAATKTFGKTDGWRYLGTEEGTGNHLLVSTGIPMNLKYNKTANEPSNYWWDMSQTNAMEQVAEGLKKNFNQIPYTKVDVTTKIASDNTMIGLFEGTKLNEGETDEYIAVGDYFKVAGKTYSNKIKVRSLTREDIDKAVNDLKVENTEKIPEDNIAFGLFNLIDLEIGFKNKTVYWLATVSDTSNIKHFLCWKYVVNEDGSIETPPHYFGPWTNTWGVRTVIVLPSTVNFSDIDNNGILEIR